MSKNSLFLLLMTASVLCACNPLGKMQKRMSEVKITTTPDPLQANGGNVKVAIQTNFPQKYFNRTTRLEIVPTLVYSTGQTTYKPYTLQGEKVAGNDKVIPFKAGGTHTYNGEVPYNPAMEISELQLRITGYRGKKTKVFEPIRIADGVIATQYALLNDDRLIVAPHEYNRFADQQQKAVINYLVGSSDVRSRELDDADIKQMKKFLSTVSKNPDYVISGITIDGFASPEGELRNNESLATDRAAAARKVMQQLLKSAGIKESKDWFTLNSKGEDWEGFKELLERSKIEDRALILRIMAMNSDVTKREEEIRNLAATFTEVAEQILPKLRRSPIYVNYRITGRTDEKILSLARTSPDDLNANELFYAATLTENLDEKLAFYQAGEKIFADDYRGANNVGWVYMQQGKTAEAKKKFEEANTIRFNAYSQNNLGVLSRREGNREKALQYFGNASAAGDDVKYNTALVNFQGGDYSAALNNMKGYNTLNHALVLTMNGDLDRAQGVLNASPEKETAQGLYLAAIIAARTNRPETLIEKLTLALQKDSTLKTKAANDREFIRYWNNDAFKALVK